MGCVLQGLVTMLLSVIDSILGRHPAYELSIWKSRVFVSLENHTIFALFLGLSSGWLGWPFFEPWTVSSTCRCLSCWGARNSNSHWQELCWHHCDQWPAASLPMSLLNSGGVKWSSQICQMSTSPKLILSIGQDIPTFTNLHIFQGVPFFLLQGLWGGAVLHQLWTHGQEPWFHPVGFFSELPKRFPCKAGSLIGTPLSTKKVLGWQVWLGECGLFFQKVPIPLIPVNHLND